VTSDDPLTAARAEHDLAVAGPRAAIAAAAAARDAALRVADKIRADAWAQYQLDIVEPGAVMDAAWAKFHTAWVASRVASRKEDLDARRLG
jgi:hypothetical protein